MEVEGGAFQDDNDPSGVKVFDSEDRRVWLHPGSVNFGAGRWVGGWVGRWGHPGRWKGGQAGGGEGGQRNACQKLAAPRWCELLCSSLVWTVQSATGAEWQAQINWRRFESGWLVWTVQSVTGAEWQAGVDWAQV